MSEGLKSTCTVMDPLGQRCNVRIDFGNSLFGNWVDKSDNIKEDILDVYSLGTVIGRSDNMSHSYPTPDRGVPGGPYGTVDQKAVILLRETSTGKARRIEIPAPKTTMFTHSEENGWRVTPTVGKNIAKKITDMGLKVTFVRGWLKSRQ